MQTKAQVEELLALAGTNPKKALGQNFLIDLNLITLLVEQANIHSDDIVIEIGPGTGSLTEETAKLAGQVICVELDNTLAKVAAKQLAGFANVKMIVGDALEKKSELNRELVESITQARQELNGRLLLVANLPYNAAASIMLNLIIGPVIADAMYVTVQKEVGQRMVAVPGSGDYGILGIFMSATGRAHIFRKLGPSVFWPRPGVDSVMVEFVYDPAKASHISDMSLFREVVGLFMSHRRKMLKACVKFAQGQLENVQNWEAIFAEAMVDGHLRPEQLKAQQYIAITNLVKQKLTSI